MAKVVITHKPSLLPHNPEVGIQYLDESSRLVPIYKAKAGIINSTIVSVESEADYMKRMENQDKLEKAQTNKGKQKGTEE